MVRRAPTILHIHEPVIFEKGVIYGKSAAPSDGHRDLW